MINNCILQINPQIKNFYQFTSDCISKYNRIQYKMENSSEDTTENEDEFIENFCMYLAHALIKDTGSGQIARIELCKAADIIKKVCED